MHNFRATPAVVVEGLREIVRVVPVDVDLAIVLVGVEGTGNTRNARHAQYRSYPSSEETRKGTSPPVVR